MMELAIHEAEESGDQAALAHACFVLDQVLSDLGQLDEPTNSRRAAAIYEKLGDERGKAAAYNEMGIAAYWHGRWEEAVSLWEAGPRGRSSRRRPRQQRDLPQQHRRDPL